MMDILVSRSKAKIKGQPFSYMLVKDWGQWFTMKDQGPSRIICLVHPFSVLLTLKKCNFS